MKVIILAFAFALTFYVSQVKDRPRAEFELRLAQEKPADGLIETTFENSKLYLHEKAVITNKDVLDAQTVIGGEEIFNIEISLTPEAGDKISKVTTANVGKMMALLINGEIKCTAHIYMALPPGGVQIAAKFNKETAERLANQIKSK